MNRILLSFVLAATPLAYVDATWAQSRGEAVVEVPATSPE